MAKYIIEGTSRSDKGPFMQEKEYYAGSTYQVQGERYAAITRRKSEAKRYSTYQRAWQGARSIIANCVNVSGVNLIRLEDE